MRKWDELNNLLRQATEKECQVLLKKEQQGLRRLTWLIRIYGRYNRLRTIRERNELLGGTNEA